METNRIFFFFQTGESRCHDSPPRASVHKQTRVRGGRGKQKHDSSDDPPLQIAWHKPQTFPTKVLSMSLFFVAASPLAPYPPLTNPLYNMKASLLLGCASERNVTGIFFKGLDKSTLSFGERPVICNIAKQEKRWVGELGGHAAQLSSGKKGKGGGTHPVISAAPEQLFPPAPNVAAWRSSRDPQRRGSQLTASFAMTKCCSGPVVLALSLCSYQRKTADRCLIEIFFIWTRRKFVCIIFANSFH